LPAQVEMPIFFTTKKYKIEMFFEETAATKLRAKNVRNN
jgi:hypothetical protein